MPTSPSNHRPWRKISTSLALVIGLLAALVGFAPAAHASTMADFVGGGRGHEVRGTLGSDDSWTNWAGEMPMAIKTDGGGTSTVVGFCVDIHTSIDTDAGKGLPEVDWDDSGIPNLNQVAYILNTYKPSNGYHGLSAPTVNERAAAVQAAIWHYTDGFELLESTRGRGNPNTQALINDYKAILVEVANADFPGEPEPTLEITSDSATAVAPNPVGPFTVRTTGSNPVHLTASENVRIVKSGTNIEIDSVLDREQFDVLYAESVDSVTISATTSATVHAGRVFAKFHPGTQEPIVQRLILADSSQATAKASVTASWTEAPEPEPEVGSLKITKEVEGEVDGGGNPIPSGVSFEIKVTGPEGYSGTINLVDGETETLDDLVPGQYTIEELNPSPSPAQISITVGPSVTIGKSARVTVRADTTTKATITNRYWGGPKVRAELNWTCEVPLSGTLYNDGDLKADFLVYYTLDNGDIESQGITVDAQSTHQLLVPATAVKIEVTSGGESLAVVEADPDSCYVPGVSLTVLCAVDGSGLVEIVLTDTGAKPSAFEILVDGELKEAVTGPATLNVPVADGQTLEVRANEKVIESKVVSVDCIGDVEITLVCQPDDSSTVEVTITGGGAETVYTLDGDDTPKTQSGPGVVRLNAPEGQTMTIVVKVDGTEIASEEIHIDCYESEVDYSHNCDAFEMVLSNPGKLPVTYTVTITIDTDVTSETITIEAGGDDVGIAQTVPEGADVHVKVVDNTGNVLVDDEWTADCAPPDDDPDPDPDPEFDVVSATAVCPTAAYLDYIVDSDSSEPLTITFINPDGDDIVRSGLDLSSRILLPGAEVAADGTVTSWPGWVQNDDDTWSVGGPYQWVLDGVTVRFEQGDQFAVRTVAYPAADPADCGPETPEDSEVGGGGEEIDPEVGGITEDRLGPGGSSTLPRTGGSPRAAGLVAFTLAVMGSALIAFERRVFQVVGQRRR